MAEVRGSDRARGKDAHHTPIQVRHASFIQTEKFRFHIAIEVKDGHCRHEDERLGDDNIKAEKYSKEKDQQNKCKMVS